MFSSYINSIMFKILEWCMFYCKFEQMHLFLLCIKFPTLCFIPSFIISVHYSDFCEKMLWKMGKAAWVKKEMKLLCSLFETSDNLAESSRIRIILQGHAFLV